MTTTLVVQKFPKELALQRNAVFLWYESQWNGKQITLHKAGLTQEEKLSLRMGPI